MRRIHAVCAMAVVAMTWPGAANGQFWEPRPVGEDRVSVGLHLGAVAPNTTFSDGSSYDSGVAVGALVSWWPLSHAGVRSRLTRSSHEGQHGEIFSPVGAESPAVWLYSWELAVRYPVTSGTRLDWFPYLGGGWGGKTYQHSFGRRASSAWGLSMSGGVELRQKSGSLSNLGLVLDAQYYANRTPFRRDKTSRPHPQYDNRRGDVTGVEKDFLGIPGANEQKDLAFTIGFTLHY